MRRVGEESKPFATIAAIPRHEATPERIVAERLRLGDGPILAQEIPYPGPVKV